MEITDKLAPLCDGGDEANKERGVMRCIVGVGVGVGVRVYSLSLPG